MNNRWLNLLFALVVVLIAGLSWHLFVNAKTTEAASLVLNILKPLSTLLILTLAYLLFRYIFRLTIGGQNRLQSKLVLGILPLTLIPALMIFIVATSFLDELLVNLLVDNNETRMVDASNDMRAEYLRAVGDMHLHHAEPIHTLWRDGRGDEITDYLNRFGIDALEIRNGEGDQLIRYVSEDFPESRIGRLNQSEPYRSMDEPVLFDDGLLVASFGTTLDGVSYDFINVTDTPFTQEFRYVRDTFTYLRHTQRKTERIRTVNQRFLFLATLGVIFGGVWLGIAFARRFLSAFNALKSGAERVSQGDYGVRLDLKTGDEIEDVVLAFNAMTQRLQSSQTELETKAAALSGLNAELNDQIEYNQTILQQIRTGILSTDEQGLTQSANPAVQEILGLSHIEIGTDIATVLAPDALEPLGALWRRFQDKETEVFQQIELPFPQDAVFVACSMVPLRKGEQTFGSLIVIEDLTQLLQAQKLAAWQEVAKRVAHEIKNPLTPIQLSIQRVRRKAAKDAQDLVSAIESAHETIMSETNLLKNLVNEFATFAKMPAPVKRTLDLNELIRSVAASQRLAQPQLEIVVDVPVEPLWTMADPNMMRQVLGNLMQNAAQAMGGEGSITLTAKTQTPQILLTVADDGPGVPEAEREKIFAPYYSKSPKGTGLGLAIVKRIIEDHDGTIEMTPNQPRGACFHIRLTATARPHPETEADVTAVS